MNREITEWLNRQHKWLQEAGQRILTNGSLSQTDITDLANLIKNPGATDSTPRSYPNFGAGATSPFDLRLISIGPVNGIDALNPREPLDFGTGNLTVVYGANGSGKSGYARIISRACGKSHSVELKPNVYQAVPAKRHCTIKYQFSGIEKTVDWLAAESPIDDLESVDVFDAENGRIYLENETELTFVPPELTLFADLVAASQRVDALLTDEQNKLTSQLPTIPAEYNSTEAGTAYAKLSRDLDAVKLDTFLSWTADNEIEYISLKIRLNVPAPDAAARKRREVKRQIDTIHHALERAIEALGDEAYNTLHHLDREAISKRDIAAKGAKALGSVAKLDGIGAETWRKMWAAAREYSNSTAYPTYPFPHTENGARCVLCHQGLDAEARQRLTDFEGYVKGRLETDAEAAEAAFKEKLDALPSHPTMENLKTSCTAAEFTEEMTASLEASWNNLEALLAPLRSGMVPNEVPTIDQAITKLLADLAARSTVEEKAAMQFDADAEGGDHTMDRKKLANLEAKKWITQQAGAVRVEVTRLKKVEDYYQWKRKTASNGISLKSGELSEKLITKAYIKRFNEELKKLGAHKVQVELVKTVTSFGRNKHSVQLRDLVVEGTRVSEILSEGERRIVALAAFLADVTGSGNTSPFIFDDPISSLDQLFEEKAISRLIDLSTDRQVLVFTHRLSFLGIMNDLADGRLHDVHIRREPWGTGQPGEIPLFAKKPDRALNNLKGERLAKAQKVHLKDGYEEYRPLAKAICSDFRILMERIVETVFLADVIQRHRRAVNTKGKIGKLVKITPADCELIDVMMTKYSCYEHSQSDEAPADVPEPDELEKDIQTMITWHSEFTKRSQDSSKKDSHA